MGMKVDTAVGLPLDLVVVSPLTRATQTALIGLGDRCKTEKVTILCREEARESIGAHICDKRRDKSTLMSMFPAVDYSAIDHEVDPCWAADAMETPSQMCSRANLLLEWLASQKYRSVAVASHSAFLFAMINGVLEVRQQAADVSLIHMTFHFTSDLFLLISLHSYIHCFFHARSGYCLVWHWRTSIFSGNQMCTLKMKTGSLSLQCCALLDEKYSHNTAAR